MPYISPACSSLLISRQPTLQRKELNQQANEKAFKVHDHLDLPHLPETYSSAWLPVLEALRFLSPLLIFYFSLVKAEAADVLSTSHLLPTAHSTHQFPCPAYFNHFKLLPSIISSHYPIQLSHHITVFLFFKSYDWWLYKSRCHMDSSFFLKYPYLKNIQIHVRHIHIWQLLESM